MFLDVTAIVGINLSREEKVKIRLGEAVEIGGLSQRPCRTAPSSRPRGTEKGPAGLFAFLKPSQQSQSNTLTIISHWLSQSALALLIQMLFNLK